MTTFLTCNKGHFLERYVTPEEGYFCDLCGDTQPTSSTMYGCDECEWDICAICNQDIINIRDAANNNDPPKEQVQKKKQTDNQKQSSPAKTKKSSSSLPSVAKSTGITTNKTKTETKTKTKTKRERILQKRQEIKILIICFQK